jgi:methyl-accepting chemotaxis protein
VNEEARQAMVRAKTSMLGWRMLQASCWRLLLGFVSARNITRPITQVVALAQQMSDGDFTHNLKTDQKDEIGQLVLP